MTRILIVAPSWVGDAVLAQPLFQRLHQRHPGVTLDVLAPSWVAPLLARMPQVHEVIPNPFGHGELKLSARYQLGRTLRARKYDQAIILPNSLKSALVPLFAGIPLRTGFVGEMRRGFLNDARKLDKQKYPLMVERFALLAEQRGAPLARPVARPHLAATEAQKQATLAKLGLKTGQPVAVFCPGAEYGPAKRWPHYAELARLLTERGYAVWLVGSGKDAALGEEIAAASGSVNLCGKTTLDQAVDVIAAADVVVSNDSGLMHIAAALDKAMIAIYGSSSPGFTPPLSVRARVVKLDLPCSPCFERVCPLGHFDCMNKLDARQVLDALLALQQGDPGSAGDPAGRQAGIRESK